MPDDSDTRNFALRENGDESSVFSGRTPRQAALKAARRLEPAPSSQEAEETEIRLREKGKKKVHIYEGWAWKEEPPNDAPEWLEEQDEITEANVSKKGIKHLEEI
ncbi:MAG: non-histone chromosomal MC1 family protein [Natronomonas sp.]